MCVCVCVCLRACVRACVRKRVSLLETVKDRLHHGNDSGGTSASGAQSHPVPQKERTACCHFFIRLQMGGCKVFALIKTEIAWSDQMTNRPGR